MILARADADVKRLKMLALHGMSHDAWKRFSDAGYKHYSVVECGFKYNMMDLQAALGIHQLARVERWWQRRRELMGVYRAAFSGLPLGFQSDAPADSRHACHLFPILIDEARTGISRDAFLDAMTARKIGVGVHYRSIAGHPYYQETFGWRPEDYPHAHRIGEQTVSLPLSPRLSDDDVQDVIAAVRGILGAL